MRCEVTSSTEHMALISRELRVPTYKHVCRGEQKRVNLGYNNWKNTLKVENNTLIPYPTRRFIPGSLSSISWDYEVFLKFFNIHNIAPNWHNCHTSWGYFDTEKGTWTGCMGKVIINMNRFKWKSLCFSIFFIFYLYFLSIMNNIIFITT